jgi:phosphopantothenoylcysteine decarboxylase / phosphopantothenate---cysteine ligase
MTLSGKRILLIIGGGIAAYKSLDLIRRLRERGASVRAVMTAAAQEFVTPLSVGTLTADRIFTDLFDRNDEHDVGHIRLSREADLVVVAPATADLMAKLANGLANDLASAVLLATDKKVLVAPAMNPAMWNHPATKRNRATLAKDGVTFIGPNKGEMAESGEAGEGRMAEPLEIVAAIEAIIAPKAEPLAGKKIIVTSGPTHEPIDPVRYIANRSSGKQGHALAAALAALGAEVRLVSGPVTVADPAGVVTEHVETAREMRDAVEAQLPADAAVFVAAVADWRTENEAGEKIKKVAGEGPPSLRMVENPDILATIGHHKQRPYLVVGFAAETQDLIANAQAKLKRKGADFIVANDVSAEGGVMGGDRNRVRIVSKSGVDEWPEMSKAEVAKRLADLIAERLKTVEV